MRAPDTFTAATWNIAGGTANPPSADQLEHALARAIARGATMFLLQEANRGVEWRKVLKGAGLKLEHVAPQYVVAWSPDEWEALDAGAVDLAATPYYRKGSSTPVPTRAAWAILADRWGRSVAAMSYHTPAGVQVPEYRRPPRRMTVLRESAATWHRLTTGRQLRPDEPDLSHVRAVLFGGDDNVDEGRAFASAFRFLQDTATGLRQVKAPAPTHGHRVTGRRIDDFRVRGLKPLRGRVLPGGGDHRIHVRKFRWES